MDKVPVSEVCEELGLRPTVFYRWQKELFENGPPLFSLKSFPTANWKRRQKRIEFLEEKVQTKDEVLAGHDARPNIPLLSTVERQD